MPSILRFPVNQEKDPSDLPESADEVFTPPAELVEQPNPSRGTTTAIRRSSATIVPEASFDEPTRPSDHPGPDLDEFPWFETTASSAPPPSHGAPDELVDHSADTVALPSSETGEVSEEAPRASLPLLLAASGVMILLAGTAAMLVVAMLQRPEPLKAAAPVAPAMVAPLEALPAPTITDPEPVEAAPAPAPAVVKRTKKKAPSIQDVTPPEVTITTPAIEAAPEPEAPAAETAPTESQEKQKKGLFGKKKDR